MTYNSNPAPPVNAGTYSVGAAFVSSDANYSDAAASGSLAIARATPTVTVACPPGIVFDGNPHSCTDAATGIGNVAVSGSSALTYNGGPAPSAGGTYSVSASFTSADSNYTDNTGVGTLMIARAAQTITFGALPNRTFGDPDFTVLGTASSGLTVVFSSTGNCTVAGVTVHLTGIGSCTITASQAGDADYNPAASVPRSFTINSGDDFTVAATLPSVTVTAGQTVTDHIVVTPNPATLSALTLTCSGLPAKSTCRFAPNPVPAGSAPTDVVLTISTTASTNAALRQPTALFTAWLGFSGVGLIGMVVVGARRKSRRILVALPLVVLLLIVGCGGRSQETVGGTPPGTSIVTVTGSTANSTHSTTFTLIVK